MNVLITMRDGIDGREKRLGRRAGSQSVKRKARREADGRCKYL